MVSGGGSKPPPYGIFFWFAVALGRTVREAGPYGVGEMCFWKLHTFFVGRGLGPAVFWYRIGAPGEGARPRDFFLACSGFGTERPGGNLYQNSCPKNDIYKG